MQDIIPIRALKDNYIWLVLNFVNQKAIIIDPGEAAPVIDYIKKNNITLLAILLTHKHWDHCNGVSEILEKYPTVIVYGPETDQIKNINFYLNNNNKINISDCGGLFNIISIPGHTLEHIAYYHPQQKILFSGDTLFTAGCGRIFEGTPQMMLESLNKLKALPEESLIYCGHEYTWQNLKFAQHVEPNNTDILKRIKNTQQLLNKNLPTVPASLREEKNTNPFLRCEFSEVIESVQNYAGKKLNHTVEIFQYLREWKNQF